MMYSHAPLTHPVQLAPPQNNVFTHQQLAYFDGVQNPRMYVAVKGVVFDVTKNGSHYAPGQGYHIFVGRDASRALAKSSLNLQDALPYYSDLTPQELSALDGWYQYFLQRYNIMGRVA